MFYDCVKKVYISVQRTRLSYIKIYIVIFFNTCVLFKVTFLTFFTFVISDPEKNILTATNIFVSMSLFYTMHLPLGLLPIIVVSAIEVAP
jgi:hypothetical protein